MPILSDNSILSRVNDGTLRIEPFEESCLTPNGYDLRIGEIMVDNNIHRDGAVSVPKGTWFAVSTMEYIGMPGDLVGMLWLKTRWARKGVIGSFGAVDAGFEGELTLSLYSSRTDIELQIGDKLVQIVFITMDEVPKMLYSDRSGNYYRQRGIRL